MSAPGADPGGPLLVTPAGSVAVATDELLAAVDRLRALETMLHAAERRVAAAAAEPLGWPVPDLARERLAAARELCARGRERLGRAVEAYTATELATEAAQHALAELVAAWLGPVLLRTLASAVLLFPGVLVATALLGWAAIPDTGDGRLATLQRALLAHPELVTSPEFARFVSLVATSVDDGLLGMLGLPLPAILPGTEPRDHGVATGALTVAALGGMIGMFRETPVAVERQSTAPVTAPPAGVRERLDRVPEVDQVRIERYEADGMPPRYVVYVAPTETFSPFATDEPWDLTSNVHGVAALSPGSLRAVELAMADAGIRAGDEVVLAGFSQGGLVATLVAASGDWNVIGLETHGAPAGSIPLPGGMAGLAVRNTDDFVPALAGPQLDRTLVQVEREAFAGDAPLPTDQAAPAHQRAAYERTADAIDAARSSVVREQVRTLDAFTADYLALPGGSATAFVYRAERVPVG